MTKKSVLLFGVLVVVVAMGAALVMPGIFWSASAQPTDNTYLPLIMRDFLQAIATASGPLYVFPSTGTTNGDAGGRANLGAFCTATDPDSHPVSLEEIENAWIETGVIFSPYSGEIWLDSAKLGTTYDGADGDFNSDWSQGLGGSLANCQGWNNSEVTNEGMALWWNAGDAKTQQCSQNLPVACGKH